jgi:ribosomal protein S18 acetylase RimI-like enzyme
MKSSDVQSLVVLHRKVFQGYNATVMGEGYLKPLYEVLAMHDTSTSIVAEKEGEIIGWIGGLGDWRRFQQALIKKSMKHIHRIVYSVIKERPRLFSRVLMVVLSIAKNTFIKPAMGRRNAEQGNALQQTENSIKNASLLVIGVSPSYQQKRLGQAMMNDFHGRLVEKGYLYCDTNTFVDNEPGNRAFRTAGYVLMKTWGNENHYRKTLTAGA